MDIFIVELCLRIIEAFTKCCSTLQKQKPMVDFLVGLGSQQTDHIVSFFVEL